MEAMVKSKGLKQMKVNFKYINKMFWKWSDYTEFYYLTNINNLMLTSQNCLNMGGLTLGALFLELEGRSPSLLLL